jgi:phosphoglycerate kinase
MVAVVGGAKVSDKIPLLENMLLRIDTLIVGGAMSYTFLKAQGARIGKSFCEKGQSYTDKYGSKKTRDIVALAAGLLEKARKLGVPVLLPVDHVCHTEVGPTATPLVTEDVNVPDGYMALDIGPKTLNLFRAAVKHASTCVWNGPMGVFEIDAFSNGTFGIACTMAECTKAGTMFSIIGGGDSAAAAEKCGAAAYISHVSTGGGASLEVLEGKELPGIAALSDRRRDTSKL